MGRSRGDGMVTVGRDAVGRPRWLSWPLVVAAEAEAVAAAAAITPGGSQGKKKRSAAAATPCLPSATVHPAAAFCFD